MNKTELIKKIDAEYNLAQGCVMFAYILEAVPWRETIKTFVGPCRIHIGGPRVETVIEFTPDQILKRYEHPSAVRDDGHNIFRLGATSAICKAFELTKAYCKATSQEEKFRAFPWYHFARVVRNCFSHDFCLDLTVPLTKADKTNGLKTKWLPAQTLKFSGGSVTLDQSFHGKRLDYDILPVKYALELLEMMKESIQSDLID